MLGKQFCGCVREVGFTFGKQWGASEGSYDDEVAPFLSLVFRGSQTTVACVSRCIIRGWAYASQRMAVVSNKREGIRWYMESRLEGSLIFEDGLLLKFNVGCKEVVTGPLGTMEEMSSQVEHSHDFRAPVFCYHCQGHYCVPSTCWKLCFIVHLISCNNVGVLIRHKSTFLFSIRQPEMGKAMAFLCKPLCTHDLVTEGYIVNV